MKNKKKKKKMMMMMMMMMIRREEREEEEEERREKREERREKTPIKMKDAIPEDPPLSPLIPTQPRPSPLPYTYLSVIQYKTYMI